VCPRSLFPAKAKIRQKRIVEPHGSQVQRSGGVPSLFDDVQGCRVMAQIVFFASVFSALGLPLIAIIVLLLAKLTTGSAARRAERRFLAFLIVMTLVTVHTVTMQNAAWLIHT